MYFLNEIVNNEVAPMNSLQAEDGAAATCCMLLPDFPPPPISHVATSKYKVKLHDEFGRRVQDLLQIQACP